MAIVAPRGMYYRTSFAENFKCHFIVTLGDPHVLTHSAMTTRKTQREFCLHFWDFYIIVHIIYVNVHIVHDHGYEQ
jgi:hypothetical protein